MSAHTPTPWIFDGELILPAKIDDGVIARVPNHPENAKGWEANAAFIVKAVNSHEALVKALEKLRSYNVDIDAGRINYRPKDHIQVVDEALSAVVAGGRS